MFAEYLPMSAGWGVNQRTLVVSSGQGGSQPADISEIAHMIGNLTLISNLALNIGALCHIFRDIDVFCAFPMVAPKSAASGKSTKNVHTCISKYI